jgi:hypothetical protein
MFSVLKVGVDWFAKALGESLGVLIGFIFLSRAKEETHSRFRIFHESEEFIERFLPGRSLPSL